MKKKHQLLWQLKKYLILNRRFWIISTKSLNFFLKNSFKNTYVKNLFNFKTSIFRVNYPTHFSIFIRFCWNFYNLTDVCRYFKNFYNEILVNSLYKNFTNRTVEFLITKNVLVKILKLDELIAISLDVDYGSPCPTNKIILKWSQNSTLSRFFKRHRRFISKTNSRKRRFFSWSIRLIRSFFIKSSLAMFFPRQKKIKFTSSPGFIFKLPPAFLFLNNKQMKTRGGVLCLLLSLLHTRRKNSYFKLVRLGLSSNLVYNKLQSRNNRSNLTSRYSRRLIPNVAKSKNLRYRNIFKRKHTKLQSVIWRGKLNLNLKLIFIKLNHYFSFRATNANLVKLNNYNSTNYPQFLSLVTVPVLIHKNNTVGTNNLALVYDINTMGLDSVELIQNNLFFKNFFKNTSSMILYRTDFFKNTIKNRNTTDTNKIINPSPSTYILDIVKSFFVFLINSKVLLFLNFELYVRLTFWEKVYLLGIKHRLRFFKNSFSTIFFLNEFIDLTYLAFRNKNLDILLPFINRILKALVIWDHKKFFLFLFSFISEQLSPMFSQWGISGLKILIKGKIGVGGNSRKRSMSLFLGKPAITTYNDNIYTYNGIIQTNTGALGFRAWLTYTNTY